MGDYSSNNHIEPANIQVILRCRPLNEDEMEKQMPVAIYCNEYRREVAAILAHKHIYRTFNFDKVFGPGSTQKDLFDQAICPVVNEILEGYNCTVLAYGQTGTGKTYTMEGGLRSKDGGLPNNDDAGVIPRVIQQIFDVLKAQEGEYNVKVTYMEIYNEEITDLLVAEECPSKRAIALMDDGKGCISVRGSEEEIVYTASEIYKILEKGIARRHTAETAIAKKSSRSHSILSITITMRECTPEGHQVIRSAKLNLVDLAGSENILRSGAREERAREAGEINKSLLTLGRVINALVEHSGHVPYRDSKLTRLLRDSLGGKTRTYIIATISPSTHCLDETLSTLDYAYRAKNIQNRPEVNQKIIKSSLIKDLYREISSLKREIHAAREKNGIYISKDHYPIEEAEKKALAEKVEHLEHDSAIKNNQLRELQELYNYQQQLTIDLTAKLEKIQKEYEQTEHALFDLEDSYRMANPTIQEKEYTISDHIISEKSLSEQASALQAEIENAASELSFLFSKMEHQNEVRNGKKAIIQNFCTQLAQDLKVLDKIISSSTERQEQQLKGMEENMEMFLSSKGEATEELKKQLGKLKDSYSRGVTSVDELAGQLYENSQLTFGNLSSEVSLHSSSFADTHRNISSEADSSFNDLQCMLHNQEKSLDAYAQEQNENHCKRLQMTNTISKVVGNFFKTSNKHASNFTQIMGDVQLINDQKLCELENKFEEYVANEERQLLEKVAGLLASSNTRKKRQLQTTVHSLRESTASGYCKLKQELSDMHGFTSSFKDEWETHEKEMKIQSIREGSAEKSGKSGLEENLQHCMTRAKLCTKQWTNTQESLFSLQQQYIDLMKSIVKCGVDANEVIHCQLFSATTSALEEVDVANRNCLSSIDYLLKLDRDAYENINSMNFSCHEIMKEATSSHDEQILKIKDIVHKRLTEEYLVDEPSCSSSTPPRLSIFPGTKFIEEVGIPKI